MKARGGNLFWGMQFRTCKIFRAFADSKSSLTPKKFYKYKTRQSRSFFIQSHTAITSIVDSALCAESNKYTPPQPLPQGEGLFSNSPSLAEDNLTLSPSLAEGVRGWVKSALFLFFLSTQATLFGANAEFKINKNHSINIVSENDAYFEPFIRSDEYYTAGHYFSYLSPEFADSWINKIAGFAHLYDAHFTRFSIALKQEIYTPENKYIYNDGTTPLQNDILFGAGLYANLSFVSRTRDFMEQFSIDLGVAGPLALGKEAQNGVHKLTNNGIARGWDYFGLKNEALINLHYGIIWRWVFIEDFFDILPYFQISLGNAYTAANAGARFRVGYGIRNDFGFQKLKSRFAQNIADDGLKIYAVFGVNGSVVGRDMFIQGNSFGGAKSGVKLNHFLYEIEFGAMIGWKYLSFGYIYTAESKRFKEQKWQHKYGSIRLEIMF